MEQGKKYLVTVSGEKIQVIGETGRYYITRDRQYRKSNPEIARVEIRMPKKKKEKDAPGEEKEERSVE